MITAIALLPIDRDEARKTNSKFYYTGKLCKQGHLSKRATLNGTCVECTKLATIGWAKKQSPTRSATYTATYRAKKAGIIPNIDGRGGFDVTDVAEQLCKLYGAQIALLSGYRSTGESAQFNCLVHGEFKGWVGNVLRGKGCPKCALALRTGTTEEFALKALEVHKGVYDYTKVKYITAQRKVNIICDKHGLFKQTPNKHLNGQGCPSCAGVNPKAEQEMAAFIESLGVQVQKQTRKIIAPYEIDLWLPEFNIGIEHHGLYWHTESREKGKHKLKWEAAERVGIRLIQIFEDEWANQKEIIKARLAALLGKANKIAARKTKVEIITFPEARDFLNLHHIQGVGPSCISYGLKNKDTLVAVATFGRARSGGMIVNNSEDWEVYRYASEGTVVGGFGKLLNKFIQEHTPRKLISYCDLRYGNGRLYKATGFILDSITAPDYWWVAPDSKKRIPRYQVQKHKLKTHLTLGKFYSAEKTEAQICADAGWRKIYGVGNQKWIWNLLDNPHKL